MPGPIKQEQLHAPLSPITSPQAYLLPIQNPFIVTEEVQPFHPNPEKVELEETKARDGVHARHQRDSAALRTWPPASSNSSAAPPGRPGSRVRLEAQRRQIGGEKGGPGERGRGQGRGAELQAAGFVQSGPGSRQGFLGDRSEAVHPKHTRARAEDWRGAKAGVPE